MKILFALIVIILYSPNLFANTFYIGKWEVLSISKKCSIGSYFEKHILIIKENRSSLFEGNSWFTFRGKVNSGWNKIGLNNQFGTLNISGKFNGTLINAKINNLAEWKGTQHCDFQLQKIISKEKKINEDRWLFCQNLFDENLKSKRYQRCDSSEEEISEDEFNKFDKSNTIEPISRPIF